MQHQVYIYGSKYWHDVTLSADFNLVQAATAATVAIQAEERAARRMGGRVVAAAGCEGKVDGWGGDGDGRRADSELGGGDGDEVDAASVLGCGVVLELIRCMDLGAFFGICDNSFDDARNILTSGSVVDAERSGKGVHVYAGALGGARDVETMLLGEECMRLLGWLGEKTRQRENGRATEETERDRTRQRQRQRQKENRERESVCVGGNVTR